MAEHHAQQSSAHVRERYAIGYTPPIGNTAHRGAHVRTRYHGPGPAERQTFFVKRVQGTRPQ